MNLASVLNTTIPAVVIGYAIYLVVHLLRERRRRGRRGGCAGCPYAAGCTDHKEDKTK